MKIGYRLLNIYKKINLREYLIIAFSFMISITVLATGLISLGKYSDILVAKTRNYSIDISTQVKKGLNSNLVDLNLRVEKLVQNSFIQDSLINMERLGEQDKDKYLKILEDNFDPFSIENLYIDSIDLYLKNGATIHHGESEFYIKDIFNSKIYTEGLKQPTMLYWVGYNNNTRTIDAIRLIYDLNNYEVKGILVVRINKKYLYEIFADYNMLEISDMYILDDLGQILSSKNADNVGKIFDEGYKNLMTQRSGFIEYKNKFILFQHLQNSAFKTYQHESWKVIIVTDSELIYKDVYAIRYNIIAFMIIFILFGILISIVISDKIAIPVRKLVKAMKEVQYGNFDVHIDYSGSSEMFFLTKSFNHMVTQTKTLINNVYKERIIRKDMELKALQAQINPHFLFNTLQMISWEARKFNAYGACDMIENLSYILETNMCRNAKKMITVRDELIYIKNYTNLIKKRFEEKITFNIQIDEELLDCTLPKLLLQPFIENSIKHGLTNKMGPGKINIIGTKINDNMMLEIIDDGIGIREESLNKLWESISADEDSMDNNMSSLAMRNIYKRIKLIYGDEFGFEIESELYRGTKIIICIPVKYEHDE